MRNNQGARLLLSFLLAFLIRNSSTCASASEEVDSSSNSPSPLRRRDLQLLESFGDLPIGQNRQSQGAGSGASSSCLRVPPGTTELCYNLTAYGWDATWPEDPGPWDPWAGSICVKVLGASNLLQLTYETVSYWSIWESAVWTGDDLSSLPTITATNTGDKQANLAVFPYQKQPRFGGIGQDKVTYKIPLDSCPKTITTTNAGGTTTTTSLVYSYDLVVVAYVHIGESKTYYPSEWIYSTNYTAWGNDVDDDDDLPSSESKTKYLHFTVPITCSCP